MEAVQVLIQTMQESRRAEYQAIEEQHRREPHEMLQMQLKLQQEHQNEVWHHQKDLDDIRRDRDRKRKLADKIAPWTDKDQPESYLQKFENMLSTAGISKYEWASRLVPLLTGIASTAYTMSVSGQSRLRFTENGLAEGARTFQRSLRARVLVLPKERW